MDAVAADLLDGGSGTGQLDVASGGDCLNLIGSTLAGIP
jgi:hypothetical protein